MSSLRVALVFFSGLVLDVVWARYTVMIQRRSAMAAASYAILILGLGAIGITAYVDEPLYLIPACAGAFIGTYGTVRWSK